MYSWEDYRWYKRHLRLPFGYLRVIFGQYQTLSEAVFKLAEIIRETNENDWRAMMEEVVTLEEKLWRVANIPPMFFPPVVVLTQKAAEQDSFDAICASIDTIRGEVFYFYSEFCDGALAAAVQMVKSAISKKMRSCFCLSFPELLEAKDSCNAEVVKRVQAEQIVVIYGVGGEFQTDFKTRLLQEIVMLRRVNNRTTIMCSALDPRDYQERYGSRPGGVEVGFQDGNYRKSLTQLAKEMKK
jgi:hypothetical protein